MCVWDSHVHMHKRTCAHTLPHINTLTLSLSPSDTGRHTQTCPRSCLLGTKSHDADLKWLLQWKVGKMLWCGAPWGGRWCCACVAENIPACYLCSALVSCSILMVINCTCQGSSQLLHPGPSCGGSSPQFSHALGNSAWSLLSTFVLLGVCTWFL